MKKRIRIKKILQNAGEYLIIGELNQGPVISSRYLCNCILASAMNSYPELLPEIRHTVADQIKNVLYEWFSPEDKNCKGIIWPMHNKMYYGEEEREVDTQKERIIALGLLIAIYENKRILVDI